MSDQNFFDTVIIGSGFSGASTAYHLLVENDYKGKVCILEARNRIGGRAFGQKIAGKHVELGCNWIHGIINNPIYKLALKYKLIDPIKDKPDDNPYDSENVCGFVANTGERVPIPTINKAYQNYFWMLKKAEDFYNRICKGEILEESSLGEYVDGEVNNYLSTVSEDERPLYKAIFRQLIVRETHVNGCNSLNDVSLRYYGSYQEYPGGHQVIPAGFGMIIQGLIDDVFIKTQKNKQPDQFKLFLDHNVVKIKWPGVETKSKEPVEVMCANGAKFKCNHLVNTMPVGVLRDRINHHALYEPSLPKYKVDCVNALGFDHINKIYVEFESSLFPKFIDATVNEIMVFWKEEPSEEEKAQLNLEKTWFKKMYSFSRITDRLLLTWVSGKEAEYALKLDQATLTKDIGNLLRSMFKNPQFPMPSNIVQTSWGTDEFCLGSYTFIRTNEQGKDVEMLGQPIYSDPGNEKPILLFAGEATHPNYFSTTHGAFLSGKRAASYLLDQN